MNDHDDLDDPGLAAALGALAPEAGGDPYPAAHRRFVRHRRRRRVAAAAAGVAGVAAVVTAFAVLGGNGTDVAGVRTVSPAGGPSTSVPAGPTASSSTSTTLSPSTTTPTSPSPTAGPDTPAGSATSTTTAVAPRDETVESAGGTVRVRVTPTSVSLLGSTPAAGYTADVRASGPEDVEVRFRAGSSGGTEHRIRLRIRSDGTLEREVT